MIAWCLAVAAAQDVVVAARDLPAGHIVEASDLRPRDEHGYPAPDDALPAAQATGAVTAHRILAGEVLRAARMANIEAPDRLSRVIPRGMRVTSVRAATSAEHRPGGYVDLLGPEGCWWVQAAFLFATPRPTEMVGGLQVIAQPGEALLLVVPTQHRALVAAHGRARTLRWVGLDQAFDDLRPRCAEPVAPRGR